MNRAQTGLGHERNLPMTESAEDARHKAKMENRKAVQDAEVA